MYAEMFSAMEDELMRLRSADFSDLGQRLVNELLGRSALEFLWKE